ncbi:hypothetical protein FJ420_00390 [Mesorhizobium sp. B3-1-3]|uniref:hypothetical protein n=1 Tax=unclassified Mesorhizobium TaxID=325217 RepID=UPI00112CED2A|nr:MULTISPECIES: hypothetical protein [unclassified Mesorhizobium]TPI76044.1 hypothetical protein FJ420_00390 [Mesorhizobium sp. B3-1-3]
MQKSIRDASSARANPAHELTVRITLPHSHKLESEGTKMTKKQYQAPVLRKVGKLSAVVAGPSKVV